MMLAGIGGPGRLLTRRKFVEHETHISRHCVCRPAKSECGADVASAAPVVRPNSTATGSKPQGRGVTWPDEPQRSPCWLKAAIIEITGQIRLALTSAL
jgi:hypothetical protein